jgi:predicted transport protein
MEQAEITMLDNLKKNTGKSLEEWIKIVKKEKFEKHGQIMNFLKGDHGFTHGFANLVAHKTLATDAGSEDDKGVLITEQYKGKEHFLPLYEQLAEAIKKFGDDVEFAPKRSYVSVRRKKQFAMLTPATKQRFEIGINLKGSPSEGILEAISSANAMCSHKINIAADEKLPKEALEWLKKAYDGAG